MTKVTHLTLDEGGGLSQKRIHLREISGEADTPLETVGQDLRAGRLRRGEDLATASKALKIRKDHLEALEEDRFESLPGRAYAIGFVRSYADYLGLDPVEAVERFKSEIAGRDDTPKTPVFEEAGDEARLPHGWVVIALVVLGLVVYGAYRLATSAEALLNEPVAPVPERIAAPAAKTAPPANPGPAPAISTPALGPAAAPGKADEGQTLSPASGAAEPGSDAASQAAETPAAAPALPKGHTYGQRNGNARVILHVLAPTRVLVQGDDGVVFINRTLSPGDSYRVPDRVGLTLSTPNAGAVRFELDGQMMGLAGHAKQIAEGLSLDPQAIVDRYNGR